MIKTGCILLLAAAVNQGLAADAPATTPPTPPPLSGPLGTPVELLDGKSLDGWLWVQRAAKPGDATPLLKMGDVWSVSDGILHDKGTPIGYIHTAVQYPPNYVLSVEQRHLDKGNGGVLFAMTGPDKVWPHCLEAQGLVGEEGDLRGIANFKLVMDPARAEAHRLRRIGPSSEKPIGQWEAIVVVVDHGTIAVTINGQFQNITTTIDDLSGSVGLQAEGGAMEFRKIEMTPIETATKP